MRRLSRQKESVADLAVRILQDLRKDLNDLIDRVTCSGGRSSNVTALPEQPVEFGGRKFFSGVIIYGHFVAEVEESPTLFHGYTAVKKSNCPSLAVARYI